MVGMASDPLVHLHQTQASKDVSMAELEYLRHTEILLLRRVLSIADCERQVHRRLDQTYHHADEVEVHGREKRPFIALQRLQHQKSVAGQVHVEGGQEV